MEVKKMFYDDNTKNELKRIADMAPVIAEFKKRYREQLKREQLERKNRSKMINKRRAKFELLKQQGDFVEPITFEQFCAWYYDN